MDQFEPGDFYPSQITETIGNVTFSSGFDSGNLKSVRRESPNRVRLQSISVSVGDFKRLRNKWENDELQDLVLLFSVRS